MAARKLSNGHTHTTFCDGQNTPAEMAAGAYALGFGALGFSGHSFCPADCFGMQDETLAAYMAEIKKLQAGYADKMPIYLGLELDSMSAPVNSCDYDYIIGSVHNISTPAERICCTDLSPEETARAVAEFGGDGLAYAAAYFAAVDEMLNTREDLVDIVGHFDLVCKFNVDGRFFDEQNAAYKKAAAQVLQRHARKFVFEINTGGMSRGYLDRPYPDYWLWEIWRDAGTPVVISSDAHSVAALDFKLSEMTEKARNFGLNVVDIADVCAARGNIRQLFSR